MEDINKAKLVFGSSSDEGEDMDDYPEEEIIEPALVA